MTNRTSVLMLLAIAVIGIYVLPSVTARFAGSHTMEVNESALVEGLMCERCHTYIIDELYATERSDDVVVKHLAAAQSAAYVNSTGILNITDTDGLANANRSACLMCHLVTKDRGGLNASHTKITIRVCTDPKCHGQPEDPNTLSGYDQYTSTLLNITAKLSADVDVHSKFYNPLNDSDSRYVRQDGVNYTRGFFACLGCHTHVGITFNLTRPNMISFNFSKNVVGGEMLGFTYDTGSLQVSGDNVTTSTKVAGISVWE